jgi:hypothetical protein
MSSTSVPTPVGFSNPARAVTPAPRAMLDSGIANDELTFVQRVRSPWWKSAWPLLVSVLFGAALLFTAGNAPATATVQKMLQEREQRDLAADLQPAADYELPSQWQWPNISGTPSGDSRLACDPAQSSTAC